MAEPKVDTASDTWVSVCDSICVEINKLREQREQSGSELRQLDRNLGAIKALENLLALPARQAKKPPEPIRGSGVGIPGLKTRVGEING